MRTDTLENVFNRLKRTYQFDRPFLKMDTQGFDVAILRSGVSVVKYFVGLQCELAIKRTYEEAVEFRDAIAVYNDLRFELSAFVPKTRGHFPQLIETN